MDTNLYNCEQLAARFFGPDDANSHRAGDKAMERISLYLNRTGY
jgi:hypothetical protein